MAKTNETANAEQNQTTEAQKAAAPAKPAFNFTRTKIVTVPLLKPAIDVPFYVTVLEPIWLGKQIGDKMEAAHLTNVTNLETGELQQLIIPAVLLSLFNENYADGGYVGKSFEMIKHAKPSGKGYHPFTLNEISVTA